MSEDQLRSTVEIALSSATRTHIEHQSYEENVLKLQPVSGAAPKPVTQEAGLAAFNDKSDTLILMNANARQIAMVAEEVLGKPVIVENGDAASCTSNIHVRKDDEDSLRNTLAKECHLTMTEGRGAVDRIVVTQQ
jgi:hypothetical protein